MKYRPEIDGLRTIAVLPVIIFHADIGIFNGGFAGVDIFFVISGYLITSIIIGDLEAGRFSILNFYERRARRILPALFLVLGVSSIIAFHIQYPLELNEFSQSIIATLLFSSNIFFWLNIDYFSSSADLKPLLHTWSLAVEEQYYILFPPLMVLIWKGAHRHNWAIFLLSILAILSLTLCIVLSGFWSSMTFYLLPFRAWELIIGAICSILIARQKIKPNIAASILGIILIGIAIFFSSESDWPSWHTLLPTLGTGLIILFASSDKGIGRVLATGPMVGIGLVSYSLYLWHQPLFAFARLRSLDEPSMSLKFGLMALAMLLAWLTWRFIEKPFRTKGATGFLVSPKKLIVMMGMFASVFFAAGFLGDVTDGWPNRVAPSGLTFVQITRDLAGARADVLPCDTDLAFKPVLSAPLPDCVFAADGPDVPRRAILLGDSHATIMTQAITKRLTLAGYETSVATFGGCIPFPGYRTVDRDCNSANAAMYRHVADSNYELIVLAFRAQPVLFQDYKIIYNNIIESQKSHVIDAQNMVLSGLTHLIKTGANIIVFEPIPEMTKDIGHFARNHFAFDSNYEALAFSVPFSTYLNRAKAVLDILHGISAPNFSVLKTSRILCNGIGFECQGIEAGVSLYVDDNHLSRFGVDKLMVEFDRKLNNILDIDEVTGNP